VHAIIYAPDAPALESALHKEFADRRVNRINMRKEYFRVSLDEIKAAVEKHHGLVTMVQVMVHQIRGTPRAPLSH